MIEQIASADRSVNRTDLVLLPILAALVWCVHFSTNFQGLWAPDAMEYADVARNIAQGHGITTKSIWTLLLEKYQSLPFPSLLRPPLFPLCGAALFRVFGPSELAVVALCGVAFVATVIPLYVLIVRFFGRLAAWLAVLLYVFHNQSLYYSISGLTEPMATLFFMIFLCVFFLRQGYLSRLLAGLIIGLAQVTSDKAIPCFVVAVIFSVVESFQRRRWTESLLLVAGFLAAVMPFAVYNFVVFGVFPYNKADPNVALIPGPSLWAANLRYLHPISAWAFVSAYPVVVINKFFAYFDGFTRAALFGGLVSPYIMVFALMGLFMPPRGPESGNGGARRCYFYILVALLVQICALSFLYYVESRYLMAFAPMLIGFAAGFFVTAAAQISQRRVVTVAVVAVLLLLVFEPVATIRSLMGKGEFSDQYARAGQWAFVSRLFDEKGVGPEAIVVTDIPWATAWYGRRTSILFPATMEQLGELDDRILPVDAVFLTNQMNTSFRSQFTQETDAPWRTILEKKPPRFAVGTKERVSVFELVDSDQWPQKRPQRISVLYVKRKGRGGP